MALGGSGRATIGKTIFTRVCIEKNLPNNQMIFNQTWYKSPWIKGIKKIKGQVLFKGLID
jgi:hypothetical protein